MTKPQKTELQRLGRERQTTYGRSRVRVQNNLVVADLARFVYADGEVVPPGRWIFADWCEITDAGREMLNRTGVKRRQSP